MVLRLQRLLRYPDCPSLHSELVLPRVPPKVLREVSSTRTICRSSILSVNLQFSILNSSLRSSSSNRCHEVTIETGECYGKDLDTYEEYCRDGTLDAYERACITSTVLSVPLTVLYALGFIYGKDLYAQVNGNQARRDELRRCFLDILTSSTDTYVRSVSATNVLVAPNPTITTST